MRGKRGVSPLIATVLLIAFAVALGAVVMNWGRSYAQETADTVREKSDKDVQCAIDAALEIVDFNKVPQLCYGGGGSDGFLYFIVRNPGSKDVEKLGITIFGQNGLYDNQTLNGSAVAQAGAVRLNITYDYDVYGPIQQIAITPYLKIGGVERACTGNALEKSSTNILNCSA